MDATAGIAGCLEVLEDHISVLAGRPPIEEQGAMFQEMCAAFQGLAIFYLLEDMNLTRYHWNLQRSVQARSFYLRKVEQHRLANAVFAALSRTDSIFDAIVTGDLSGAERIEAMSPAGWTPSGEYEDNYLYFRLVHALVRGAREEAAQHLAAFEVALDGRRDPRLALCRTFLEGAEADFWDAFADFTDAKLAASAIEHDDGRLQHEPWLGAFAFVSIEAVAWHALAVAHGFHPPDMERPGCPSVALRASPDGPSPDIFLQLEARFNL